MRKYLAALAAAGMMLGGCGRETQPTDKRIFRFRDRDENGLYDHMTVTLYFKFRGKWVRSMQARPYEIKLDPELSREQIEKKNYTTGANELIFERGEKE